MKVSCVWQNASRTQFSHIGSFRNGVIPCVRMDEIIYHAGSQHTILSKSLDCYARKMAAGHLCSSKSGFRQVRDGRHDASKGIKKNNGTLGYAACLL